MTSEWRFYCPCSGCRQGWPVPPNFSTGFKLDNKSMDRVICDNCGGLSFGPPRVGRRVDPPWWKALFGARPTWEYRDDTVTPWPWSEKRDGGDDGDRDKSAPEPPTTSEADVDADERDRQAEPSIQTSNREDEPAL